MPHAESHRDAPGESPTDQAANAAFDAIEERLRELGYDTNRSAAIVMVGLGDGQPAHATVAAHMPGDPTPERMLDFAVMQIGLLAAECGLEVVLRSVSN